MKLKILLQYKNRYLYIAISLTTLILVINNIVYLLIAIPFLIYIYRRHFDLLKIVLIVFSIYIGSIVVFSTIKIGDEGTYTVKVVKDIKVDTYTSFVGKIDNVKIKVYIENNIEVKPGDMLKISGEINSPSVSTIPGTFDYKNYLKSQRIKYTIFSKSAEYIESSFNINVIPYYIDDFIDNNQPLSGDYIKTFILAERSDIDVNVNNQINKIGISHLFAVSGLHIAMLVIALEQILNMIIGKKNIRENIIILLLLIYLIATSFSPSVLRASMMYGFLIINKRLKFDFSSLDILSFIYIFLLIINPYYYYDAGFLLSFLVTFTILLSNSMLKNKSKVLQLFIISLVAFLATIPIVTKLNYQVNLLSILLNIVFLIYVTYVILPLSYITFLLPFFDKINYIAIKLFEALLAVVSEIDLLIIELYFSSVFLILIYYASLFFFLVSLESNHKIYNRLFILLIVISVIYISPKLNIRKSITFIDIYGDSTLVRDSFDRCNILIDTGEDDVYNSVINYMKSKNIRRLDYLVISHYHSDHYGEANEILKEYKVTNVISKDNVHSFENKSISCGTISMFIYPFEYQEQNENNNSIIMSIFISDKHYFFTGDIEESRELDFVSEYNIDVDYIKVPHHGSITSSSSSLLESITPEAAFIIVSIKNIHGHPHDDVIKRYEEMTIPVYRTDLSGTIEVYYIFGKEYKRIHSP